MVATLAKMAVPTYYIESQAAHEGHEVEDPRDPTAEGGYYTGGGKERPGEWYNPAGLFRLKDGGIVRDKTFYALAGGFSPDGTSLVRNAGSERRSPGFDLTFSADKSISALWAISRAEEREALERAVIDAARRALADTIFRHCAMTRVGAAGPNLRVEAGAMLAATFLHRTSRDGDPQLHVHATIFNLVKTDSDGLFRALHGYPLYSWKMAAGAAFRSHLAYLMRTRLGIEMERHGPEGQYTRVAAMDPELEQAWSKRRREIVETVGNSLGEEALANPAQMAAATLATRRRKGEGATTAEDLVRFREEAAALVDLEALRRRLRETPVADVTGDVIDRVRREVAAIPAKLARMDAVFRLPDMVETVENALAGLVARDAVERWHEFSLTGADLVPLAYREPNADARAGMAHKRLFTTRETLEAEHRLKRLSQMFVADQVVPVETVEAKLQALRAEGKTFSSEQTRAIHHAVSHRLALIEGAAGSGKSHILHPLAELWRGEGKTVRALAVAWRTAVDLGTDMQAPPAAVHPFLRGVAKGTKTVDENTVLVVDEAGMLSVRQTLQLVALSRTTGCQLVLVGDTQQQQPVEAGPGLRILRDAVGSVRIDHIRRQLPDLEDWLREADALSPEKAMQTAAAMTREEREAARARFRERNRQRRQAGKPPLVIRRPWQRGVSALLRNGAMDMAFRELHRRGRMGLVDGKEEALHDLVARWAAYTAEHPTHSTIVMARTRADVRALSVLLRERHHGEHKDDRSAIIRVHRIGDRGKAVPLEVRLGERLRIGATVNDLGLYNGTIVTVTGIEQHRGGHCRLTVRTADRRRVSFAPEQIRNWLGETALDHGYAATVTSAQGMTVDAAFLLLDEGMARETTYPACTRHRRHLELVADQQSVAVALAGATPEGEPGRTVGDDEILAALGQLCGRSQPKAAALDHLLAETRPERGREREGEIELASVPTGRADGLGGGSRRRADRAALRIVAAADRRTRRLADRATAVALAADMTEVERDWVAMPADPAAQLDRHRAVLHRVRVFLRRRTSGREDGQHHPRISGLGYVAFQSLHRRMQRSVREADNERRKAESQALKRDWKKALRNGREGTLSAASVSRYGRLLARAQAFLAPLDDGAASARKDLRTLWRRRLEAAPSYDDVLHRFVEGLKAEDALITRREAQLPGSTLATRRLADHMAALNAAIHLEGLPEAVRRFLRRLVRQHREAREAAGVTRTDAPWVSDKVIANRVEARALNKAWREIGTGTLALLDRPDEIVARTAAFAAELEQRLPDSARKWRALAEGHLRQLARQLGEAFENEGRARDVEALDGYLRLPRRVDAFVALLAALPPAMAQRVRFDRADWQRRLTGASSPVAVYERFVRDLVREEHTIREQETARPGSTLATRHLARHMAVLQALASHDCLPAGEREGFQRLLDAHRQARVTARAADRPPPDEIRQRNEISRTIAEARAHLLEYPALLARAPNPLPDETVSRPGLFRRMRRFFEDDIPPTKAPHDFDPDYRWWDVQAEVFVRKFRAWRADASLRDHVDRRWIDMSDLIAEFEAIRSAHPEPYRIEIPDAFPARDQRHDPGRLAVLLQDVIRPEDERNHDAVVELARRNRAWPEETLAVFRSYARQAETRSLFRLSAGLPPHLGASLRNLSEVTWQYQGEDIERRRTLEQGYGMVRREDQEEENMT